MIRPAVIVNGKLVYVADVPPESPQDRFVRHMSRTPLPRPPLRPLRSPKVPKPTPKRWRM